MEYAAPRINYEAHVDKLLYAMSIHVCQSVMSICQMSYMRKFDQNYKEYARQTKEVQLANISRYIGAE